MCVPFLFDPWIDELLKGEITGALPPRLTEGALPFALIDPSLEAC